MAMVAPTIRHDNAQQVRYLMPQWLVIPEILHARGVIESAVEPRRKSEAVVRGCAPHDFRPQDQEILLGPTEREPKMKRHGLTDFGSCVGMNLDAGLTDVGGLATDRLAIGPHDDDVQPTREPWLPSPLVAGHSTKVPGS